MKSLFFLASLIIFNSASSAQVSRFKTRLLALPDLRSNGDTINLHLPASLIHQDHAAHGLPFFCRQELTMDKRFPMQLRFRAGSMQQADWLEQKPTAQPPR